MCFTSRMSLPRTSHSISLPHTSYSILFTQHTITAYVSPQLHIIPYIYICYRHYYVIAITLLLSHQCNFNVIVSLLSRHCYNILAVLLHHCHHIIFVTCLRPFLFPFTYPFPRHITIYPHRLPQSHSHFCIQHYFAAPSRHRSLKHDSQ